MARVDRIACAVHLRDATRQLIEEGGIRDGKRGVAGLRACAAAEQPPCSTT